MAWYRRGDVEIGDSYADKVLVHSAYVKVFELLKERGEVRETFLEDGEGGGVTSLEDLKLPLGFGYIRVCTEGYLLLKALRSQGLMIDDESAEKFLVVFIGHKRGIF